MNALREVLRLWHRMNRTADPTALWRANSSLEAAIHREAEDGAAGLDVVAALHPGDYAAFTEAGALARAKAEWRRVATETLESLGLLLSVAVEVQEGDERLTPLGTVVFHLKWQASSTAAEDDLPVQDTAVLDGNGRLCTHDARRIRVHMAAPPVRRRSAGRPLRVRGRVAPALRSGQATPRRRRQTPVSVHRLRHAGGEGPGRACGGDGVRGGRGDGDDDGGDVGVDGADRDGHAGDGNCRHRRHRQCCELHPGRAPTPIRPSTGLSRGGGSRESIGS